jgi:serine/threonine-protein kinase
MKATDALARFGLPNHEFDRVIAQGGMSVVCHGYRLSDRFEVALKLITPEFAVVAEYLEKVFQKGSEGEIAASLHHRNVVRTIDYGKKRGQYYIVMEYIDGPNLAQVIRSGDDLWRRNRYQLLLAVGRGLTYIHQHNLVHRDFCPKNILLGSDGVPKIIDFGLAIPRSLKSDWKFDRSGTPSYMAPEQVRGQQVDFRTDIYAFGVTAYEILTGEWPYPPSRTRLGKMQPHLNIEPPGPRRYDPSIPAALEHVVMRALQKTRDKRYQTMDVLMRDLQLVASTFLGSHVVAEAAEVEPPASEGVPPTRAEAKDELPSADELREED